MTDDKEKKDYCDAGDQKKVVDKMVECDETPEDEKKKGKCYNTIVKKVNDGCMS